MTTTTRAPRTHLPHAVPVANLEQAILDLIQQKGPAAISDIGDALSYSHDAIRKRLLTLEQAASVHRVRQTISRSGRGCLRYLWKFGPFVPAYGLDSAPKTRVATQLRAKAGEGPTLPTRQVITRDYPTINRRDPLVSALFGPARQEAA